MNLYSAILWPGRHAVGGAVLPQIIFNGGAVQEGTSAGTLLGSLNTVGTTGVPAFSLTDSDGNRVALSGSNINVGATLPDYETHPIIFFTVSVSGVTPALSPTTFAVQVTNVLETTLAALSLTNSSITHNAPAGTLVGAVNGKTSGSTLILLDDAGGRFAISGTDLVTGLVPTDASVALSHSIVIRETHPDAANRDNNFSINIVGDTTPAIFEIEPVTGVGPLLSVESEPFLVAGITVSIPWTTTGASGEASINGGPFLSSGSVGENSSVVVRGTSSFDPLTTTTVTFSAGGVSADFDITTKKAPTISTDSTSVQSGNTLLLPLVADEDVSWATNGGADLIRFEVAGTNLRWTGNTTRSSSSPQDANSNNVYEVQLRATSNSTGFQTTKDITVTVTAPPGGGGAVPTYHFLGF